MLFAARSHVLAVLRAFFAFRLIVLWVLYAAVVTGAVIGVRQVGVRYEGGTKDAMVWAVLELFPNVGASGGTRSGPVAPPRVAVRKQDAAPTFRPAVLPASRDDERSKGDGPRATSHGRAPRP